MVQRQRGGDGIANGEENNMRQEADGESSNSGAGVLSNVFFVKINIDNQK